MFICMSILSASTHSFGQYSYSNYPSVCPVNSWKAEIQTEFFAQCISEVATWCKCKLATIWFMLKLKPGFGRKKIGTNVFVYNVYVVGGRGLPPPSSTSHSWRRILHTCFGKSAKHNRNKTCVTLGGIQDGTIFGFLAVTPDLRGSWGPNNSSAECCIQKWANLPFQNFGKDEHDHNKSCRHLQNQTVQFQQPPKWKETRNILFRKKSIPTQSAKAW